MRAHAQICRFLSRLTAALSTLCLRFHTCCFEGMDVDCEDILPGRLVCNQIFGTQDIFPAVMLCKHALHFAKLFRNNEKIYFVARELICARLQSLGVQRNILLVDCISVNDSSTSCYPSKQCATRCNATEYLNYNVHSISICK